MQWSESQCQPGMYFDEDEKKCVECAEGSFSSGEDMTFCTQCPPDMTVEKGAGKCATDCS